MSLTMENTFLSSEPQKRKIIFSFSSQIALCISVARATVGSNCVLSLFLYDYGINSES